METTERITEDQVASIEHFAGELQKVIDGTRRTGWGDDTSVEANLRNIAQQLIAISQAPYPETFRAWMEREFDTDDLRGIAEHGASSGWQHLTYYHQMLPIYDKYHEEIWTAVYNDGEDHGYDNTLAFIASFQSAPTDDVQLKSLLVQYMAERTAQDIVNAWEDESE